MTRGGEVDKSDIKAGVTLLKSVICGLNRFIDLRYYAPVIKKWTSATGRTQPEGWP